MPGLSRSTAQHSTAQHPLFVSYIVVVSTCLFSYSIPYENRQWRVEGEDGIRNLFLLSLLMLLMLRVGLLR